MKNRGRLNSKSIDFRPISFVLIIGLIVCSLFLFSRDHSPAQVFVFALYCGIAACDAVLAVRLFINSHRFKHLSLLMLGSLAMAILLEGLTIVGSPASHFRMLTDWSKKRLLFFALASFTTLLVIHIQHASKTRADSGSKGGQHIARGAVCCCAVVVVCLIVSFGVGSSIPFAYEALGLLVVIVLIAFCFAGRLTLSLTFFFASFLVGSLLVYGLPVTTGLSWDDQIHYQNALNASYLFESQLTDTDIRFSEEAVRRATDEDAPEIGRFDPSDIEDHARALDASYNSDVLAGRVQVDKTNESVFALYAVGYVPSAFGLWLGRLFHIGFSATARLAKMMNLLSYCAIVAAAIEVAAAKKSLFVLVGLLPTNLFLAANFSYDAWLNSLVMLGFAFYLRYAWGEQGDFTVRNIAAAFVFMFLGLAVKAVYFPLIGLFFVVPKSRFSCEAQRKQYCLAVFLLGLLTFASFALPYLFTVQTDAGDTRGGSDVNPLRQITFILEDPLRYGSILFNFFTTQFLSPLNSIQYGMNFAYIGKPWQLFAQAWHGTAASLLLSVLLVCNGVLSCDENSVKCVGIGRSVWAAFVFLFVCTLVATALYVSFTPVGFDTVNGCQYRYLLPTLVPCLSIAFNVRGPSLGARRSFNMAWMLAGFALCLFCIALYIYPKFL